MGPNVVDATGTDRPRAVARAVEVLNRGGVIAIPTDTVYGLACRSAFPESIARIFSIKQRPPTKALPFLLPDASRLSDFTNDIPRRAARLVARFWPGALTLVLGPEGRTVAVRVPDHGLARDILRGAIGPVVATSANLSGEDAAIDAAAVESLLGDKIDLLIDGGPSPLARESTLVRIFDDGRATILRPGALTSDTLAETLMHTIVCVCTGNTCRSPMAEALLRNALAVRLGVPPADLMHGGFRVLSAGLGATLGAPAAAGSQTAMERRGLSLTEHASQPFTDSLAECADVIYVMTESHRDALRPSTLQRGVTVSLLDPDGGDITDPFGGSDADYERCARRIESCVSRRVNELIAFRLGT